MKKAYKVAAQPLLMALSLIVTFGCIVGIRDVLQHGEYNAYRPGFHVTALVVYFVCAPLPLVLIGVFARKLFLGFLLLFQVFYVSSFVLFWGLLFPTMFFSINDASSYFLAGTLVILSVALPVWAVRHSTPSWRIGVIARSYPGFLLVATCIGCATFSLHWFMTDEDMRSASAGFQSDRCLYEGDFSGALNHYNQVLDRYSGDAPTPDRINTLVHRARLRRFLGNEIGYQKDIDTIRTIVSVDEDLEDHQKKRFPWLLISDEDDVPGKADFWIGDAMVREGEYQKAVDRLLRAAKAGNRDAQNLLGDLCVKGTVVKQNYKTAANYYSAAAKQRHPAALISLGSLYEHGQGGIEKNHRVAMYLFQLAAEEGNSYGQLNVGKLYEYGPWMVKDIKKALYFYKVAADLGNNEAYFYLGHLYERGHCVEQNDSVAIKYYQKGVEAGDSEAANMLAYLLARREIRLNEAESYIHMALKKYPECGSYIDTLGWVLYKQRRHEEALVQLEKAATMSPDDDDILGHLNEVRSKLGIEPPNKEINQALEGEPGQ